jgi:hypothetical protein
MHLLAIIGMASETNNLATAMQVPVDQEYLVERVSGAVLTIGGFLKDATTTAAMRGRAAACARSVVRLRSAPVP